MTFLYLLIMGIILCAHNSVLLGVISLVVAFVAKKSGEKTWSVILGIILMLSGEWFIAGLIGLLLGLLDDDK